MAKEALTKLESALSKLAKSASSQPQFSPRSLNSTPSPIDSEPPTLTTQETSKENQPQPFWVIPRSDISLTSEELGRGRWGVVKVATYSGDKVAARCLYGQISSEESHKVFLECLDAAAKMRHPNILPFIGAVVKDQPVIITELMPSNLRMVLDAGKLYNYQIATLALDIAQGLLFLHTTRPDPVVHGDLGTTNVLVRKEVGNQWRAKLSDFMTAKYFRHVIMTGGSAMDFETSFSPTQDKPVFTSPSHSARTTPSPLSGMYRTSRKRSGSDASINKRLSSRKQSQTAPDMLDLATLTTQRDVYSFGVLLVELCTGTQPLEVSFQFLTESITWSEMSAMVKLCAEYSPDKRPGMEDVVKKLKTIHRMASSRPSKFNMTVVT